MTPDGRIQKLIDRCFAVDWRNPVHEPARVVAAYDQWQSAMGMRWPIRLFADPADAGLWATIREGYMRSSGYSLTDILPPICAMTRSLEALDSRVALNLPQASEWEVASVWSCAMMAGGMTEPTANFEWRRACINQIRHHPRFAYAAYLLAANGPWASPPAVAWAASAFLASLGNETVGAFWQEARNWLSRAADPAFESASGGWDMPLWDEIAGAIADISEPMIEACAAGAFAHFFLDGEILVIASPSIWTAGGTLHRIDGPAIGWPRSRVYALDGAIVPEETIGCPTAAAGPRL